MATRSSSTGTSTRITVPNLANASGNQGASPWVQTKQFDHGEAGRKARARKKRERLEDVLGEDLALKRLVNPDPAFVRQRRG